MPKKTKPKPRKRILSATHGPRAVSRVVIKNGEPTLEPDAKKKTAAKKLRK